MNNADDIEKGYENPAEIYLACIFSGEGYASEDTCLQIATSIDGIHFHNICPQAESLLTPPGGVRDPIILFWQGQWYLVYSYGPNIAPLIFLASSNDLVHWKSMGSLRLAPDTENKYIDVPQWIVDTDGIVHLIACLDDNHYWVETHALNADPATWGDQANWSPVVTMTDVQGKPLVQGNSFVAFRDGVYFMGFNEISATAYYLRTSRDLVKGWSAPQKLEIDNRIQRGDSENLVILADGTLRYYISNGNFLKQVIWYVDSADQGLHWTPPNAVGFSGFAHAINWSQFVRITDPTAIALLVKAHQVTW